MRRIIIVGTLHLGLTRMNDLYALLEEVMPDQLLVELKSEDDVKYEDLQNEMGYAATWARTKGGKVSIGYFDTDISVLKDGVTEDDPDYQACVQRQVWELKRYSWRDLNRKEIQEQQAIRSIETELFRRYIDIRKWDAREEEMLKNIKQLMLSEGTILILTGAANLDFFEKNMPDAEFPYRTNSGVTIGTGDLNGKGVYATRDFMKEEIVIMYHLTPLTPEEFDKLSDIEKQFVYAQDGQHYLYSEPERYVNHSDHPNTRQDHNLHADVAIRDIKKGEPITTDSTKDDV